jgi:hypothetical protein
MLKYKILFASLSLLPALAGCASTSSGSDPLAQVQSFALSDVQAAQAEYAANPSVPTYGAATECLSWMNSELSGPNAPLNIQLAVPKGVVSGVADIDVGLNTANSGLPKIVLQFNQNCGGYVEDLKAEAAAAVAKNGTSAILGIKF